MKNTDQIQEFIDNTLALAPEKGLVEIKEAEELAPRFILARAALAKFRLDLEVSKNKIDGEISTLYKYAMVEAKGNNAVEKKAHAEADPMYLTKKEEFENLCSFISYMKIIEDVFHNLHIFYRTLGKYSGM